MYTNTQRPGAIIHMLMDEFKNRVEIEGRVIVRVENHKTGTTYGAAKIVLTKELEKLVETYLIHLRPQTEAEELFITSQGAKYIDYVHKIKSLAKRYNLEMPITATTARKLAATKAHETLTTTDTRRLAKHMGHALETSDRYYQAIDTAKSTVKVHTMIQSLISGKDIQ